MGKNSSDLSRPSCGNYVFVLLGAVVTTWNFIDYLNLQSVKFFLYNNITLFFGTDYHLPGIFLDNPEAAINGSL